MERALSRFPGAAVVLMAASLLAIQPGGLFRFVWIKLVVVVLAVLAGLLSPARTRLPSAVGAATAACVVWIAAAMTLSETPLASIAGRWPRYEGLLTLAIYVAVFAVGARVLGGAFGRHRRAELGMALAVAGIALAVVAALESAGLRPLGGGADVRPGATLGNATDQGLAGVVVVGVLAAQGNLDKKWQGWLRRVGLLAGAGAAVLSGSRAALVALLIVAVFSVIVWLKSRSWTWLRTAAGAVLAVAGIGVGVLLAPGARDRLLSAGTVDGRWLLWGRSLGLIADHPAFGVGPSGFVDALPAYLNGDWARTVGDSFPADSPHNWPLQVLAAGGFPLLVLVVVLIAVSVVAVVRNWRAAPSEQERRYLVLVLVTVAAYALALLTHFTSIGTTGLVAFLCGGLVAVDGGKTAAVPNRFMPTLRTLKWPAVPRFAGMFLVLAALAVAVPAAVAEWPMARGAGAAAAGNSVEAQRAFERARQLRPWDSDTALLAAQAFAGPATEGDEEAARRAVEWGKLALQRTPGSEEAGMALAVGHLYSGDVPGAKELLDTLIADAPYSTALYVHRGVAQFGLGNTAEAIADLEHAAALDPSLDTPWRVLANIHQRLGNMQEAFAASQRADFLAAN